MADLLFEIGAEEIPAGFMPPALRQLEEDLARALGEARLSRGEVKAVGTPRRLAVWARDVAPRQADARSQALGPPVAQAFDARGQPTAAALGFARSQGVPVSELKRLPTPKGERLAFERVEKGKRAEAVLPDLLQRLAAGLRFKKSMRSRYDEVTFPRPVRWLAALYGGRPLRIAYGEVRSGRVTYGHRFLAPRAIRLGGTPEDYLAKLRRAGVIADQAERRAAIQRALDRAAGQAGGRVRPDEELLEQVTFLVEHPTAVAGAFEASSLELPPEVVVSEMRNHQRYFAVMDRSGRLTNRFIAVSGTPLKNPAVARHGYQRVLRARLADARFFFVEDRKRSLEERIPDLARRTYQAKLGSELDRVRRIESIAVALCDMVGLGEKRAEVAVAARLCKCDLGTRMVGEFPELQGIMGGHYARLQGLPAEIADAIEDHYRPVGASEEMPRSDLGALVGLADRLLALVGIIGIGEKATGAADPFGLRRAAIGILRIVQHRGYHLSLRAAVGLALDALSGVELSADRAAVGEQVREFVRGRLKALWSDEFAPDLVEAVLAAGFDDVADARRRLEALAAAKARPDFVPLAAAFKRVANICEKAGPEVGTGVAQEPLREPAEKELVGQLERVEAEVASLRQRHEYPAILRAVASLKPAVDHFFEDVLVMAEDAGLRRSRLALMQRVADLFADVADFRRIQADGAAP